MSAEKHTGGFEEVRSNQFLSPKEWFKFKRGQMVGVHTMGLSPQIDGEFKLEAIRRSSNFPYRIQYEGQTIILRKDEVYPGKT